MGYSNANYALSEIKDPVQTIKRAAPIAIFGVSTVYMLINIAYFAVVSKEDILNSNRIIAYAHLLPSLIDISLINYNQGTIFSQPLRSSHRKSKVPPRLSILAAMVDNKNHRLSADLSHCRP